MAKATCPECALEIELDTETELGELIMCENCGANLIITASNPFALEAFEEEEK